MGSVNFLSDDPSFWYMRILTIASSPKSQDSNVCRARAVANTTFCASLKLRLGFCTLPHSNWSHRRAILGRATKYREMRQ